MGSASATMHCQHAPTECVPPRHLSATSQLPPSFHLQATLMALAWASGHGPGLQAAPPDQGGSGIVAGCVAHISKSISTLTFPICTSC